MMIMSVVVSMLPPHEAAERLQTSPILSQRTNQATRGDVSAPTRRLGRPRGNESDREALTQTWLHLTANVVSPR
jgi:hypothetical protein